MRDTLNDIRIPKKFTNIVWRCILTAKMKVLWNGEALEEFTLSRGIQQGDPLSPYIFVFCIERLSQLINEAVNHGFWKPIQLSRNDPKISYLCFADDLIMVLEVSMEQVAIINQCLNAFCESSSQWVSNENTRIFFSQNVHHTKRYELSQVFDFQQMQDLGKYLGVSILHKRTIRGTYKVILDKVKARLSAWKATSLSMAGRLTLVKSVISVLL